MGFEVDNKKRPKDLWDLQDGKTYTRPLSGADFSPKGSQADSGAKVSRNTASGTSGKGKGRTAQKKSASKVAYVLILITVIAAIFIPAGINAYSRYQQRKAEAEARENPAIRNDYYVQAALKALPYPAGIAYDSCSAQTLIEPYSLTVNLSGSAATNRSDYILCSEVLFRTFYGLGTVVFNENDTGVQYVFNR